MAHSSSLDGASDAGVETRQSIIMHLINTTTLKLEYFIGGCHLPYAILSHTWETDEVTFADFSGKQPEEYENKAGFDKIRRTCLQAKEDGFKYAWVDTCCINKDSSAELSEAINSMYMWYNKAAVCYAYITDFQRPHDITKLRGCRWFSRGWTLQELLAPGKIIFYGEEWTLIGTKGTMLETLQQVTGVPAEILSATKALDTVSVAARMSWAAYRETTRVEDMAYCLLGIFDVNMPLLYGEGSKAFLRLQSEIMSQTQDDSLFAWCADQESATRFPYRGLFASSPKEFADCGGIKHFGVDTDSATTVFGNGRISLNCGLETRDRQTLVAIKCYREKIVNPLAIRVSRIGIRTYLRSNPSSLFPVSMQPFDQDVVIEKFAERKELLASDDVHQRGSICLGDLPETLRFVETIPFKLRNSTEKRLSVVDALEAGKVAFRFELVGTEHDIFLIFWVDQLRKATSYRYCIDTVSERRQSFEYGRALTRVLPILGKNKPTRMDHQQEVDSVLAFVATAGRPRDWESVTCRVGSTTIGFILDQKMVNGHEVQYIEAVLIRRGNENMIVQGDD